jgi:hypothetical protein
MPFLYLSFDFLVPKSTMGNSVSPSADYSQLDNGWKTQCCEARKDSRGARRDVHPPGSKIEELNDPLSPRISLNRGSTSNEISISAFPDRSESPKLEKKQTDPLPLPNWTQVEQKFFINLLHAHPQARHSPQYLKRLMERVKIQYPDKTDEDVRACCRYLLYRTTADVDGRKGVESRAKNNAVFST